VKPGDRVTPGPMPLWFKAACAVAAAYVAWLWFDHLLNVEWILLWATGRAR
jgi:type VI protein secretion system component VasF